MRNRIAGAALLLVVLARTAAAGEAALDAAEIARFETMADRMSLGELLAYSCPSETVRHSKTAGEIIALGPRWFPLVWEGALKEPGGGGEWTEIGRRMLKVPFGGSNTPKFYNSFRAPPRQPAMSGRNRLLSRLLAGYDGAAKEFREVAAEWYALKEQGPLELWTDTTVFDDEDKELETKRRRTALGEVYRKIENLGIFVLPALIEEVKAGRYDFFPVIRYLTDGKAPRGWGARAGKVCVEWWEENKTDWLVDLSKLDLNVKPHTLKLPE